MSVFLCSTDILYVSVGIESEIPVNFIKNGNYDAIIVSDYDYAGYIYARRAGIKKIMGFTSTAIMYLQIHTLGLPNMPSLHGGKYLFTVSLAIPLRFSNDFKSAPEQLFKPKRIQSPCDAILLPLEFIYPTFFFIFPRFLLFSRES